MSYDVPTGPPSFPQGPPGGSSQGLAPVLLAVDPPMPQSRATVLIRLLMVIPHLFVLWVLGFAVMVVAFIGWVAALFTGRLPAFAADFLTGCLRWATLVSAYVFMLTGAYPPFSFEDTPYPVRLVTLPGRLNRFAVFFRIVLIIPAWFVAMLATFGSGSIVALVTWLIVLIRGRMPNGLHQAYAAVLRYTARVNGYFLMLTSAYPGGLFGDRADPVSAPPGFAPEPGFPPAPGYAPPANPWLLVLSSGARKLVGWFLVIGVVAFAGVIAGDAALVGNTVTRVTAYNDLQTAANTINAASESAGKSVQACGQNLACVQKYDGQLSGAYTAFGTAVQGIAMPDSQDSAAAATIAADADKVASIYHQLATASSAAQYNSIAPGVVDPLNTLKNDFYSLQSSLS